MKDFVLSVVSSLLASTICKLVGWVFSKIQQSNNKED